MLAPIEWHTLLCSHFFFLVILKCYTTSIFLYEKEWKCHFRYWDQICHFKHLFEHCIITLYFQDKHQCAIQKYKEALDEDFSFMLPLFMISIEYRSLNLTAAELESLNLMVTVCIYLDHVSSVIVRMFALSVVDMGSNLSRVKSKTLKIVICCLSAMHTVLRSKNKECVLVKWHV